MLGVGGALVYLIFRESKQDNSDSSDKVFQIDWQKTYDQAIKECQAGKKQSCANAERARAKGAKPVNVVRESVVETEQVYGPDPARNNAIKACNDGDNRACCWLKKSRGEKPPKPCVPSQAVSGLHGFYTY